MNALLIIRGDFFIYIRLKQTKYDEQWVLSDSGSLSESECKNDD